MPFIIMKYASEIGKYNVKFTAEHAYGVSVVGDSEIEEKSRGYSCILAGIDPGKVFEDKESPEALEYLDKLKEVNPAVGFGFVEIK